MRPIPIAQYLNQFGRVNGARIDPPHDGPAARPRVLSVPADSVPLNIDAQLGEAVERGRQEGLAAARAEFAAAILAERKELEERDAARRLAFQANEYARFGEKIENAMAAIEDGLAQTVARILKPYLSEAVARQASEALSDALSRILSRDAPSLIKITGPEPLLGLLREKMAAHPVTVEYVASTGVDVTVEANQTIIQSQLQAWIDHIASIDE
ncbi:MAG: hypothetical protein ABSG83_14105 [Roseiarcus sp.]|jgi:hypothetical protein